MSRASQEGIRYLPRGGVLLPSSRGPIQYGVVPETIKDTMESAEGVPTTFVIPSQLFSTERFMSLAELEFPAYWNYYCKGIRTHIVCRAEQRERLIRILAEALFGPRAPDPREFSGPLPPGMPDLPREMAHFKWMPDKGRPMTMEDVVEFVEFGSDGTAVLPGGVRLALEDSGGLSVVEKGRARTRFHGDPPVPYTKTADGNQQKYRLPLFGVTVIGSGHGFDPGNRCSGFIIWIDGCGVMVDPPVDAMEWLAGYDIGPRQIDSLILTHCHADHDAGTLQKLLAEGRVTIYTTDTVLSSFVAKYSHLTNMDPTAFRHLFDHFPVRAGEPISIHGASFTFRYSLHSIPCIGFEASFRGKSMIYPSDTLNDPAAIRRLRDAGVLSQERARELLHFPWHHTLVMHEAGIPPIHTPIEVLAGLEESIKKRLLLVHVSARSLPENSGLKIAPTGLEHTVDLHAAPVEVEGALELLEAMARVEILSELPVARAADFLRSVKRASHPAGARIVARGEAGKYFYIVYSGEVEVRKRGRSFKIYPEFDYFGETALITGRPRVADVYARTDVTLLVIERADFLNLLRGTDLPQRLVHLAELRRHPTWELLSASPLFTHLTSSQKTQLQAIMEPLARQAGDVLGPDPVIVARGRIGVTLDDRKQSPITRGGFAGEALHIRSGTASRAVYRCLTPVQGYEIKAAALRTFFKKNPGVYLRLAHP